MGIKSRIVYYVEKAVGLTDKNRKITNIFDYNNIIRNRPDLDRYKKLSNQFYGYSYILKRFSGYTGMINAVMEHAPALDILAIDDCRDQLSSALIVNSIQRREFLRDYLDKVIFPIGPSIYYAQSIYREYDREIIKKQLGKTLLIYPLHDIENFSYIQNTNGFINYVNEIKNKYKYDTVLVSMYFVDIERGRHIIYEKQGWIVLSAGRRNNYDFNDCMKTIIELADYAVFQAYASAIGYCIYEGVPVSIYPQPFRFVQNGSEGVGTDNGIPDDTMHAFEKMFEEYNETISKEKYDFCNYWYGYESVMAANELKLLFEFIGKMRLGMSKEKMKKIATQKQFEDIKELLLESIG